jgi:hypothetical protein
MIKNKTIFAIGATFLFLAVVMIPASASVTQNKFCDQEYKSVTTALNNLMDKIERAESNKEILKLIKDCCSNELFTTTPVLREILVKIIEWTFSKRSLFSSGSVISNIFNKRFSDDRSKEKFVISFGSYQKKIFSKKDEKLTLFKQGFAYWRYSGKAKLSQGRTIIAEREPFGIKQQIKGSQTGILLGFSGLFIDVESKLTGNSYVFIMGNARIAKAFDLSPFSD